MSISRRNYLYLLGVSLGGVILRGKPAAAVKLDESIVDKVVMTIVTKTGHHDIEVEIVNNPATSVSILGDRRKIQPDQAIMYSFNPVRQIQVSTQGVPYATDLLFISRYGKIFEVHANVMPNLPDPVTSMIPAAAALQMVGGTVRRFGIVGGDYVLHRMFGRTT